MPHLKRPSELEPSSHPHISLQIKNLQVWYSVAQEDQQQSNHFGHLWEIDCFQYAAVAFVGAVAAAGAAAADVAVVANSSVL
uniref:Uncharacterized protein n=1 Tax=Arundo donax TaxID=35708 RepID=A0A0A9EWM9_ARUDO